MLLLSLPYYQFLVWLDTIHRGHLMTVVIVRNILDARYVYNQKIKVFLEPFQDTPNIPFFIVLQEEMIEIHTTFNAQ